MHSYLSEQIRMIGFKDALETRVEVVEMEVAGQSLSSANDHFEVASHEIQALHNTVCLVEAGLWEEQHHERVEQLLVGHKLSTAHLELGAVVYDAAVVHFTQED